MEFRITEKEHKKLEALAANNGVSKADVLRMLLLGAAKDWKPR
jgi:hypothetical protein